MKFKKISITVLSSVFVFNFIVIVLGYGTISKSESLKTAQLRTLNRLMPPLKGLVYSHEGELSSTEMDSYLFYYKKVGEYLPDNPNAHYMQGFCYAQQGDLKRAKKAYIKTIEKNPNYYWAHYNLGIVYFKLKEWDKAGQSLKKALAITPEQTLKYQFSSKVFQQLIVEYEQPGPILMANLKASMKDSYGLLALIQRLKSGHIEEIPATFYNQLEVKIF